MNFKFMNSVDKYEYIRGEIFKQLQERCDNTAPSVEMIQEITKEIFEEFPALMPETKIDVEINKKPGTIKVNMRIIP